MQQLLQAGHCRESQPSSASMFFIAVCTARRRPPGCAVATLAAAIQALRAMRSAAPALALVVRIGRERGEDVRA